MVNVKVPEPEFEGQTKTRLGNPEVRQIVDSVVSDSLITLFEWNPQVGLFPLFFCVVVVAVVVITAVTIIEIIIVIIIIVNLIITIVI